MLNWACKRLRSEYSPTQTQSFRSVLLNYGPSLKHRDGLGNNWASSTNAHIPAAPTSVCSTAMTLSERDFPLANCKTHEEQNCAITLRPIYIDNGELGTQGSQPYFPSSNVDVIELSLTMYETRTCLIRKHSNRKLLEPAPKSDQALGLPGEYTEKYYFQCFTMHLHCLHIYTINHLSQEGVI